MGIHSVAAQVPRVVIVDDDDLVRSSVARVVRAWAETQGVPLNVGTYANAADALVAFTRGEEAGCVLVISDLNMPDARYQSAMDGIMLFRGIRAYAPDATLVLSSGSDLTGSERAKLEGVRALFMPKPFATAQLRTLLEQNVRPAPKQALGIIVADDDDDNREAVSLFVEDFLERMGPELKDAVQVLQASNGRELVRLFATYKVALVVTDNDMPVMSGLEAVIQIRKTDPETPVSIMTGYPEAVADGMLRYDYAVFGKPVASERLGAWLREKLQPRLSPVP